MDYFLEPDSFEGSNIKVELNLSDYTTESDFKGATDIDTSTVNREDYLISFKLDLIN